MAKTTKPRAWLMKSEPDAFSIDDLKKQKKAPWDGVRNYQARNNMRQMKLGDLVLFYHSNAKPPGVVGIARVCTEAYPDHTAWDPKSNYHDPKSTPDAPRWDMVDVEYVETLPRMVSLEQLRDDAALEGLVVTQRSRLSVTPVEPAHFRHIVRLGGGKTKL
jgi:predicted RNA-binding protein with PUA-like domain